MPPTRKSKSVKRLAALNEASAEKYGGGSNKKKQKKRKLSDKLGPQWSKGELSRFYDAYRKHGKDWRKVAAAVRNRSIDMVEALYNMNRAYLSLPEGTASVVGLIAMMTDHYNVMEGSDSERESNVALGFSRKSQKRKLGKDQFAVSKDNLQSHASDSLEGCLSLLKRRRLDGGQPRAVGKRTPRFPVSYSHKKDGGETYLSPIRKGRKSEGDNDDEIEHVAALLTEASQRGGSPQASQTPYRRRMHVKSSSVQSSERMHPPQGKARAHLCNALMDEDRLEGSIGSRGAETGDYTRDSLEGVGTVDIHWKGKNGKKGKVKDIGNHQFDDGGEACSGTEEGLNASSRGKDDIDVSHTKGERSSEQGQRKRKKKLYFGDESSGLDALQTLVDLSLLMMPESPKESGSSVQLKDEGPELDMEDKSGVPEATSTSQSRSKSKLGGLKQRVPSPASGVEDTDSRKSKLGKDPALDINAVSESEQQVQSTTTIWKRKRKPSSKLLDSDAYIESNAKEPTKTEGFAEEENKPVTKGKRTNQISTPSKQWKSIKSLEGSLNSDVSRTGTGPMVSSGQLPTASQVDLPPKRKSRRKMSVPSALHPKEKSTEKKLKNQLNVRSSSVQDRALYQKEKIQRCLSSHLVRRWCTFEWFYSALDYPWFAKREFEEYLNHVGLGHIPRLTRVEWGVIRSSLGKPRRFSEHYLRGEREKLKQYRESVRRHYAEVVPKGLPADLAKPLTVGQRVIALHPKTREVHDGKVLTFDQEKCRVQFDRPEIGVEFVMDVDCMPLNPLDNMPEALRRQISAFEKSSLTAKQSNRNGNLNFGGPMMFASSGHVEKATSPMSTSIRQGKGDMSHTTVQPKGESADIDSARQTDYNPRGIVTHNQAREDDVRALSELNRALEKKVSSTLLNLRQRNTYPVNALPPWQKAPGNSTVYGGLPSSFDTSVSQESGSSVAEIVEGSRLKAHTMVNAAIQAMSSRKGGEEAYLRIREALDSIDYQHLTSDSRLPVKRPHEQVNGLLISGEADPGFTGESSGPKSHTDTDKKEAQVLSEVITACVMAVHMIQTCTERQYPPAVVAQVLDNAVTSLHPRCPQNVGIYREIQMCMGRIKTQILALVPT